MSCQGNQDRALSTDCGNSEESLDNDALDKEPNDNETLDKVSDDNEASDEESDDNEALDKESDDNEALYKESDDNEDSEKESDDHNASEKESDDYDALESDDKLEDERGEESENIIEEEDVTLVLDAEHHFVDCAIPGNEGSCTYYHKGSMLSELLQVSEEANILRNKNFIREVVSDDWNEAVTGWKNVHPYASYSTKKRKPRRVIENNDGRPCGIRCVQDDIEGIDNDSTCFWKCNVEPVTYRYIPNNGQYRLNKICQEGRDWISSRKRNSERTNMSIRPGYLYRDMKRMLKNDFSRCNEMNNKVVSQMKSENRVEIKPEKTQTSMSMFSMVKTLSDLYSENLSTRLNELNKELKRDSTVLNDEQNRLFAISASKMKPQLNNGRDVEHRKPQRTMSGDNRVIVTSAKQRNELRPLEKVTPQQRIKEDLTRFMQQENSAKAPEERHAKSALEITNDNLERLRIMPLTSNPSKYFGRVYKRKQDSKTSKNTSSAGGKLQNDRDVSAINMEGCVHSDDTTAPGQSKRGGPSLKGISGHRIKVGLSNMRLL